MGTHGEQADENAPASEPTEKRLAKTLTFGLGLPIFFDPREERLLPINEDQRKLVYQTLRQISASMGHAINREISRIYVARVLELPEGSEDDFKISNPRVRAEVEGARIIAGSSLSQVNQIAQSQFTGKNGEQLRKGSRSLPTFRTDGSLPIPFRADGTRLHLEGDDFYLVVQPFEIKWAEANGLRNWIAFPIRIPGRDKTLRVQLMRAKTGEDGWKQKTSRVMRNSVRRAWMANLIVEYSPSPYRTLDRAITMGIDLGVATPAAIHIRTPDGPLPWAMRIGNGRRLLDTRKAIRWDITRILRGLKQKSSGISQEVRASLVERLRKLRKEERRIMKTAMQKLAAEIADIARRNGAGTWQVEDLTGDLKEDQPWLKRNWAPGMLLDALEWQAAQWGASPLVRVNPRYTSQMCSNEECHHISRENRPKGTEGQAVFRCVECGHRDHADKNAARNLSKRGIEDLIRAQRPEQDADGSA